MGGAVKSVGDFGTKAFGMGQGIVKTVSDQIGQAKYRPGRIDIDETAFKDQSKSNQLIDEIRAQRDSISGDLPYSMEAAQLGNMNQMTPAQLASANQVNAVQLDPSKQAEFRNRQSTLAQQLALQAQGQGPSLASEQFRDNKDDQVKMAMALAASQRGYTPGQNLRSIRDQTDQATQFASREAAKARIAEQLAAREQLAGVAGSARGQDLGLAQQNATLGQQANLSNQNALNTFALQQAQYDQQANALNNQTLNDALIQQAAYEQQANLQNQAAGIQNQQYINAINAQLANLIQGQQGNLMDLEAMKVSRDLGQQELEAGAYKDFTKRRGDFVQKIGQGIVTGMGAPTGGGAEGFISGFSSVGGK